MGGVGIEMQKDKSLFQDKRKYNRSCLHLEDQKPREEFVEPESNSSKITNQNYGLRVQGPWVFGICCRHMFIVEHRLFIVQKRPSHFVFYYSKRN